MPERIGVAVVGCGGVSTGHLSAYAAHAGARLVATVDARSELAEGAAKKWGADRWCRSVGHVAIIAR
jgi:predicted dehydrogenase